MSNKSGPGFHHIAFNAFDFDAAVAFYKEAFGFEVAYSWGDESRKAAMIDIGSGDYVEIFSGGTKPSEQADGVLIHFALRYPDIDSVFAKAVAAGATAQMEPKDVLIKGIPPVPVRIAFVKAPNGEVIELFQNEKL